MPVLEASLNPAYLVGFLIFLAVIGMAIIRQKETRAIASRFTREEVLMAVFAVTFYGVESQNKKPQKIQGALIMTGSILAFHSRFGDKGLDLPLESISGIGTTDRFCGKALHQTVVSINIKGENNKPDRVAFRIPHPANWVRALRARLESMKG